MTSTFVGEGIEPVGTSFAVTSMAAGRPGLPEEFSWNKETFAVRDVVEQWTETGPCRHGSGERYVRKHWFRIRTTDAREMKIYFERQARSPNGSRWRLFSVQAATTSQPDQPPVSEVNSPL